MTAQNPMVRIISASAPTQGVFTITLNLDRFRENPRSYPQISPGGFHFRFSSLGPLSCGVVIPVHEEVTGGYLENLLITCGGQVRRYLEDFFTTATPVYIYSEANSPIIRSFLRGFVVGGPLNQDSSFIQQIQVSAVSLNFCLQTEAAFCHGYLQAMHLVNSPANIRTPADFLRRIRRLCETSSVTLESLIEGEDLLVQGFQAAYAVTKGAINSIPNRPFFARLSYRGNPSSQAVTALVGKGIVFDFGGNRLKSIQANIPGIGTIDQMHYDGAGAMIGYSVLQYVATNNLRVNVDLFVSVGINAISETSVLAGEILTPYGSNETIEFSDEDAEGRVLLADTMGYIRNMSERPSQVICLGGITGPGTSGYAHINYQASTEVLSRSIEESAARTGELVWRMPLTPTSFYEARNRSHAADVTNVYTQGHVAGLNGAGGQFMRRFLGGQVPFGFLDVSCGSNLSPGFDYFLTSPVHYPLRPPSSFLLLVDLLTHVN